MYDKGKIYEELLYKKIHVYKISLKQFKRKAEIRIFLQTEVEICTICIRVVRNLKKFLDQALPKFA